MSAIMFTDNCMRKEEHNKVNLIQIICHFLQFIIESVGECNSLFVWMFASIPLCKLMSELTNCCAIILHLLFDLLCHCKNEFRCANDKSSINLILFGDWRPKPQCVRWYERIIDPSLITRVTNGTRDLNIQMAAKWITHEWTIQHAAPRMNKLVLIWKWKNDKDKARLTYLQTGHCVAKRPILQRLICHCLHTAVRFVL
jgi:hypothetical protein